MAFSASDIFTFVWRIENFRMCPHQPGEKLYSPAFTVEFLEATEWRLYVAPRGKSTQGKHVSCYLQRTTSGNLQKDVTVGFMLSGLSARSDKNIRKKSPVRSFEKGKCWGYGEFISREELLDSANELLPDDAMTVKCCIWRTNDEQSDMTISLLDSLSRNTLEVSDTSKANSCSAVTRIKVRYKSLLWPVRKFTSLQTGVRFSKTLPPSTDGKPFFEMCLFLDSDRSVHMEISRRDTGGETGDLFARCKIKTLGTSQNAQHPGESEHYFEDPDVVSPEKNVWKFPIFITAKDLIDGNYLSYMNNVLYLYCEFFYSIPGEEFSFEIKDSKCSVYHSENDEYLSSLRSDYHQLYKDRRFADVTIKAGTETFQVHRSILAARSSVFGAMFESDMKEKQSGVVDIVDVDSDTMDRLLTFIYTDALEDMSHEDACKLYAAADKYNIVSLKCRCLGVLLSTLSESTICDVLCLADTHQDEDLLEAVRGFIHGNAHQIFHSQNWKDLTQNHIKLAADMMLHVLTKKCLV